MKNKNIAMSRKNKYRNKMINRGYKMATGTSWHKEMNNKYVIRKNTKNIHSVKREEKIQFK